MKNRIPKILLLLMLNFSFGLFVYGQTNFQYETKIINGEELAYSFKPDKDGGNLRNDFPPIWDNPGGGSTTMGIILKFESNPRVNNVPLEPGDYIGGFYTDDFGELKCGGASPWPGDLGVVMSLAGDDNGTPEKDGFVFQEQIYFRVFSWERMKEYDVDVIEFDPNSLTTDKWFALGLSEVIDLQALVDFDFYISASENPLCLGNDVTLQAGEFVGSNGNYTYSWSSDPPGFNFDIPNPPTITPDETTTFFLTVSDGSNVSDHLLTVDVNENPEIILSATAAICEDDIYTASAEATNYSSVLWTTAGDGYFVNDNALETGYYPGPGDKAIGEVSFTFTAQPISPCLQPASEDQILEIKQYPSVDAGDDIPGCNSDDGVPITANGIDFETIIWETDGDGTFENSASITTTYYPGTLDLTFGEVDLTICVEASAPCTGNDCDEVTVIFYDGPSSNAPPQFSRCENQPVQCVGVTFNSSGLLWTTQGDGTFDDPTVINATYYGGEMDRLNGGTTITLNALPNEPCTQPATKDVNVILHPLPRLTTFGENTAFICPTDDFLQLDADLENYSSFLWSTLGDGTFSGANTLSPEYYPGTGDYQNEIIEIELTGAPVTPCTTSETFSVSTIIYSEPEAEILTQNESAYCGEVSLSAQTDYTIGFNWTTSGDGFFDNSTLLNPVYTPGPQDLELPESVTLTLEAISPCDGVPAAQAQVQLFFQDEVSVDAGPNAEVCETDEYSLALAAAAHYDNIDWTTDGDGTFSNPQALNPAYIPGSNDIQSGMVELTMTGFSISPCTLVQSDQIMLTITQSPEADAGTNTTICDTDVYEIQDAAAAYFTGIFWETDGDGNFDDINNLSPVYTPGTGDIAAGSVELTLQVEGIEPCGFITSDSQVLTIQPSPTADAGPNSLICDTETLLIEGAMANHYSGFTWVTNGDGTFTNPNAINPEYTPGTGDLNSGNVTLTLEAFAIDPCSVLASDSRELEIQESPESNAGSNAVICDTDSYQLMDASATNFDMVDWETSGDGIFDNSAAVNPEYTPGAGDLANGSVTLTMHVTGILPCEFLVSDNMTLTIQQSPVSDAGNDGVICDTETFDVEDAQAMNFDALNWQTSGDGVFDNSSILNPEYTPGAGDIAAGSVMLTLNASGIDPCSVADSDNMELTIQQSPVAMAGLDDEICSTTSYTINDASVNQSSSLTWETSGDGTFSDEAAINPVYYPGFIDLFNGNVTLTLNAFGVAPCNFSNADSKELTLQYPPEVDAGSNTAVCNADEVLLGDALAENSATLSWETNGDGVFSDPGSQNPTYLPGTSDIDNGLVTLTLTAEGILPCDVMVSDQIEVSFQQEPTIDAGPDATICEDGTYPLDMATAENYNALLWLTSGDGTFSNFSTLNPIYYPGALDIELGTAIISVFATGVSPCYYPALDDFDLTIQSLPTADAGSDMTACDQVEISGAVINASSSMWTTSGDGTFENESALTTTYYPGPDDLAGLAVEIQLTAFSAAPCVAEATDNMNISFDLPTIVDDQVVGQEVQTSEFLILELIVNNPENGDFTWYKDGVLLSGENSGTLYLFNISPEDAGIYQCFFTNICGEISSNEAFIEVLEPVTQTISLEAGWQGISSFVEPDENNIELLFQPVEGQMTILSDNMGFYWPSASVNTLGDWSNTTGYKIKMEEDATLIIEGKIRYPKQSLTINPGWTYLPVNSSCAIDVESLFGSLPSITLIKDMAGPAIYLPEFGVNNLETLEPGKAYQIYNDSGAPIELELPDCD